MCTRGSPIAGSAYGSARRENAAAGRRPRRPSALTVFRGAPKRKQWAEQAVWRAEKSYTAEDRRVRSFDADEIQAFAMVFGLPVSYFFLAPPASETGQPVPAALLLPLITVTPEGTPGWREYHDAVGELLADDEN